MTQIMEILGQKFALFGCLRGNFLTILGVRKVVFNIFSKLFRECLGTILGLKRATFGYIYSY